MKLAVCVKAVPGSGSGLRLDGSSGRLLRDGELSASMFDLHALEEALRLREQLAAGEVIVVSLGPPPAQEALRKPLAMGADRSVLISDDAFAGADLLVTAAALAAVLRREQPDLVLFGQQSPDGDGACLPAAIAETLELAVLSQVVEVSLADGQIRARRQTEVGYETLTSPLPAVVSVIDSINQPRYPSLKGIVAAKGKPQQLLDATAVGGPAAAGTTVLSVSAPPARSAGQLVYDEGAAPEVIIAFLRERGFVP